MWSSDACAYIGCGMILQGWCLKTQSWKPRVEIGALVHRRARRREHQTMQQCMWQPDMLQVAKFLDGKFLYCISYTSVKRMQGINPYAGSNKI